jgi:hypothetical protein
MHEITSKGRAEGHSHTIPEGKAEVETRVTVGAPSFADRLSRILYTTL